MYGQFYITCEAFPGDEWISVLAAFTTVVAGSLAPAEVQQNVPAKPNASLCICHSSQEGHNNPLFVANV